MLPRHRRRIYLNAPEYNGKRTLVRIAIGIILLVVVWYAIAGIVALFDGSIGKRASVSLSSDTDTVDVSLQGEDWQRADGTIRLYAGDAVASRASTDTQLRFFDGTRMRLDQNTEVEIVKSDERSDQESKLTMALKRGKLWMTTPSSVTYSGSILRTVTTEYSSIEIAAGASVQIDPEEILVISSEGQGVLVTFSLKGANGETVVIGEGQYLSMRPEDRAKLAEGLDPYELRDPTTLEQLRSPFLVSSIAQLGLPSSPEIVLGAGSESSEAATPDLLVESPENNAQVSSKSLAVRGRVSSRVGTVLVQGQPVQVSADGTFSAELNITTEKEIVVRIEAQDKQGIPLSTVERVVKNTWNAFVEPVRIIAPVGSGETLITALSEIEITGEAPINTAGIIVNDYRLQLFQPNARTWSYLASTALGNMKVGENKFTVFAVDANGNRSTGKTITIVLESAGLESSLSSFSAPPIRQNPPLLPGSLTVTGPSAGTETSVTEKEALLEGTTSADTASISVNGYTLSLYSAGKTTWNYIASTELQTLKRGRNVYRIVSRNAKGEILDVLEYVIVFNP